MINEVLSSLPKDFQEISMDLELAQQFQSHQIRGFIQSLLHYVPVSQSIWAVITNYDRLSSLNDQHLFLIVLEAGMSKTEVLAELVSGGGLLPGSQMVCPHMADRVRELSRISFIRALISLIRVPPSSPIHLPKGPPSSTITELLGFQHHNFVRT